MAESRAENLESAVDELGLIPVERVASLQIGSIHSLYADFVSASQVKLLSRFGPGRATVESALGARITLTSGETILDLTGGIGVLGHGHNHPEIIETRTSFAREKRMEVHKNFLSPYIAALSHNVAKVLPADLSISYFPNSGAEAVEGAVKMAYKFHGGSRSLVLHSNISFHGKLLGAGSLTASPEQHFEFPRLHGAQTFLFGELSDVQRIIDTSRKKSGDSDVYAVIIEPLSASSMREVSVDFLLGLRALCDKERIVLIADEVYSGWGKTGYLFNFMRAPSFCPDIVVYAKTFGGGKASISGYTSKPHIARKAYDNLLDATLHSTTYNGFGEETATAIKAVEIIVRDDYPARAREIGARFSSGVEAAVRKSRSIAAMRGSGALWGFTFRVDPTAASIAAIAKALPAGFFEDASFAQKLVVGAAVNYLYECHGIMTYFGSNHEKPLLVSFPMVASTADVDQAIRGVTGLAKQSIPQLLIRFAKSLVK